MIDKFKTCKDCPDRVVGCHSTCEGYIDRCKRREEEREKARIANEALADHIEGLLKIKYRRDYSKRNFRRRRKR